jgi:hypothetical protein
VVKGQKMETTHRNKCEAGTSPQAIQKILEIVIEVRCPFREESSWREELGKQEAFDLLIVDIFPQGTYPPNKASLSQRRSLGHQLAKHLQLTTTRDAQSRSIHPFSAFQRKSTAKPMES